MLNIYKSIIALIVCFLCIGNTYAFLGQDNGLNLYESIDSGLYELDSYELLNEISGGEGSSVTDQSSAIFERSGVPCEISDPRDILALSNNSTIVSATMDLCAQGQTSFGVDYFEKVHNSAKYLKNSAESRAKIKVAQSYDIAAIGIYSDGSIENSPFDLMIDLEEIDAVIFTEKLDYQGSKNLFGSNFSIGGKLPFAPKTGPSLSKTDDTSSEKPISGTPESSPIEHTLPEFVEDIIGHIPACAAYENNTNISKNDFVQIISDLAGDNNSDKNYNGKTHIDNTYNNTSNTPESTAILGDSSAGYTPVFDPWECNEFICITVKLKMKQYGLAGGNSFALENILSRVAKHLDKTANTSLTQKKMTTNNLEISSILTNLSGVLRGLTIHTETRPVPILDLPEDETVMGDEFTLDALLESYYSNVGLNYKRKNDLQIYSKGNEKMKALQTAGGMPIIYSEERINELKTLSAQYMENNRRLQSAVRSQVEHETFSAFDQQFTELERFTAAMADFSDTVKSAFLLLDKIPTRQG